MKQNSTPLSGFSKHPILFFAAACLIAIPSFVTAGGEHQLSIFGFIAAALIFCAVPLSIIFLFKDMLRSKASLAVFIGGILISAAAFIAFMSAGKTVFAVCTVLFLLCLTVMALYSITGRMNSDNFIFCILILAFIIRLIYVIYTPYNIRQHDVSHLGSGHGHMGYIEYLLNDSFRLPDFDPTTVDQFYHPPLHHYIAAVFMKINISLGAGLEQAAENLQLLSLFYSSLTSIALWKILGEFRLKGSSKAISMLIFSFLPGMVILSGSINNDMLCMTLCAWAIRFTLRWYREQKLSHIIPAALCIGLSMMAKTSGALIAPAMAFVFLAAFIKGRGKRGKLFAQYCVFGIIAVPIGIWWSVYNFIRHAMPLAYVQRIPDDNWQYIGNYSLFERFFDLGSYQFASPYLALRDTSYLEHNSFIALFKTAVFDESNFIAEGGAVVFTARLLLGLFIILAVLALVSMIFMCLSKAGKETRIGRIMLLVVFLTVMGSYLSFCIQFPHVCTQNFRYVIPAFMAGCAAIGIAANDLSVLCRNRSSPRRYRKRR